MVDGGIGVGGAKTIRISSVEPALEYLEEEGKTKARELCEMLGLELVWDPGEFSLVLGFQGSS